MSEGASNLKAIAASMWRKSSEADKTSPSKTPKAYDVKIPTEPNQMATAVLSGSSLKFSYCGLDRAIALLREQYVVGTVEIRIMPLVTS